ncbi:hypothetical protein QBC35DRAFT_33726 [Podospora australis]|uniref:Uncharacterized protein n=1 Tax=Podospora australis TaxID=1536484 RepID=A0AAN7ALE4_9PEZI|nr:hypothetical protein QBC35DRAFT_33726 [Podospora australis]
MSTDKTIVLITGANSGIGLETVLALSQSSDKYHILLGTRSLEKGETALANLASSHGKELRSHIEVLQLDVTSTDSITAATAYIEKTFGRLDVLISNAGVIVYEQVDTLINLRRTFETNVFGAMVLTESLLPLIKKSAAPRIIYVSSEQGSISLKLDPNYRWKDTKAEPYRMSKAAMNMMAACHKYDYREWGCKVCSFNPGFCVTNLTGEETKKMRVEMGARSARDPAVALVDVLEGKRDEDIMDKSGIVDLDGGVRPW